jgi:gamma-glutamylcyclotransferase (GGCT)/AIG2-like uncharacterized protein YtfP
MQNRIFVYGTLRSEFDTPYAAALRTGSQLVGKAWVMGSIYEIGGYPGYRPEPEGWVHGEVYTLSNPVEILGMLDEYEGSQYERVLVDCGGEQVWIYRYREQPDESTRIVSGDFCLL